MSAYINIKMSYSVYHKLQFENEKIVYSVEKSNAYE